MEYEAEILKRDLGHGVSWTKVCDSDGNWIGILEWHKCVSAQNADEFGLSAGGVYFTDAPPDVKGPRWQLLSGDPLTIGGSILCRSCGLHGFVTDGCWVPA